MLVFLLSAVALVLGIVASLNKKGERKFNPWLFGVLMLSSVYLLFCIIVNYMYFVCFPQRLDNLISGRNISPDAMVKSNIVATRVAAELWYDDQFDSTGGEGSYEGVCNSPAFQSISKAIENYTEKPMRCFSSKTAYCVAADEKAYNLSYPAYCEKLDWIKTSGKWCADNTGYSGPIANCSVDNIACQPNAIKLEFESGPCDTSIDPYDQASMGVKDVSWVDDKALQVIAHISLNCAENIGNGGYEVSGNKIILKYKSPQCQTCAKCMCSHRLTYRLINLEKKDYTFEIKRTY